MMQVRFDKGERVVRPVGVACKFIRRLSTHDPEMIQQFPKRSLRFRRTHVGHARKGSGFH